MRRVKFKPSFFFQISTIASFIFFPHSITAQVIPDKTLPNNSQVTVDGNTFFIEGGTRRGSNLFHSFEQFSLLTGKEAIFNNNLSIHNIFSRVTGNSPSNIDGLLRANGSANLFLINPNGIIFGPNAQLNIGGSFLGSTANSIIFADGFEFNAKTPSINPLLTISTPVGLDFSGNPGKIEVQGIGHSLVDSPFTPFTGRNPSVSFQVKPTQTLALIGGEIVLTGGLLTAEGGKIELGSVDKGFVRFQLNSSWFFNYEDVSNFKDITLNFKTLIDVSGNGGSVHLQGDNISLSNLSIILNQNSQSFDSQVNGLLSIDASKTLKIQDFEPGIITHSGIFSETLGIGQGADIRVSALQLILENAAIGTSSYSSAKGGDINLSTQELTLARGGVVGTATAKVFGESGRGGNINVSASEKIEVFGESPGLPDSLSAIASNTRGNGNGGNITLFTSILKVSDRGFIGTNAIGGIGNGGDVTLNVSNSVELIGGASSDTASSLISSTFGQGNAGRLTLNTSKLSLKNGAAITASTFFNGEAGGIVINASDFVEVNGGIISSSASFAPESLRRLFGLPLELKGFSGNVSINTSNLRITEGGLVTVRNDGVGNAGIVNIKAGAIILDRSLITATTQSGEGGNLNIFSQDIRVFDNSQISTMAGGIGNGGNVTIDTNSLILDDSRIQANAFVGNGGNISIDAQIAFISPTSLLSASSQLGINGTVNIDTPENFFQSVLNPLNLELLLPTQVIEGSCLATTRKTLTLANTGTGGIPTSPGRTVESFTIELEDEQGSPTNQIPTTVRIAKKGNILWERGMPIVPANRIVQLEDGRIVSLFEAQLSRSQLEQLLCYGENN